MKKVTDFLEQHVQWLVLLLAVAFVGYMAYSYLYTPPISVMVGKPPALATPADVDQKIVEGAVKPLEVAMANKEVSPPKVADVLGTFDEKVGEKNAGRIELAADIFGGTRTAAIAGPEQAVPKNAMVNALPKPPPAMPTITQPVSARWTVITNPGRTDVAYVRTAFTINSGVLANAINVAFGKQKVPLKALNAEFVKVEVYRREQLPNGQWSPPKLIPSTAVGLQAYPGDEGKDPRKASDQQAWFNYEAWADKNQALITHPPFYKTAADVPVPVMLVAGQAAAPAAPAAPRAVLQPPPPVNGLINPIGGAAAPVPGGNGPINPAMAQGNLQVIVNDVTLKEGKTYSYAVRYRLFNPLYTKLALAVPQVANEFDYASPDPNNPKDPNMPKYWTAGVTPEPRAYIFVKKVTPFRNEAEFSVWNWKDGHWKKTQAPKLNPGDPVSATKGESRWTLVDVRKDSKSNEPYVIVMDEQGALEQRDEKTDGANPILLKLESGAPPGAAAALAK